MGRETGISWTHHTFNPWQGCQKVSPACANCYAERLSLRWGKRLWGPTAPRELRADAYWRQPFTWAKAAAKAGARRRVFCASMADVFEDRPDVVDARARLWETIEATPELDWLLLTKRPENIERLTPAAWWRTGGPWPSWVWVGVTAEDQRHYDARVEHLLRVPAPVRFLSCEPLLGPIDLSLEGTVGEDITGSAYVATAAMLHWIIVGGESGPGSRPMRLGWAEDLRDQAKRYDIAFHFKQWGEWVPEGHAAFVEPDSDAYPDERWQNVEDDPRGTYSPMFRAGTKRAGRELAGRTWDEVPGVEADA